MLFHVFALFCLCWKTLFGVFSEIVSVTEGDSVTLNFNAVHEGDHILWKYGAENTLIAKINIKQQDFFTFDDVLDGRFRNRLKLDHQTGSLTITNIRSEHAGIYELEIIGSKLTIEKFSISVYARLPVPVTIRDCSSSSSSLSQYNCSVLCSVVNVSAVSLSWYKGNSVLSSISVSDLSISLSLPLEVEYQDENTYSCVINNTISNQTTHLDINTLCQLCPDEDLHWFYIVWMCAVVGSLMILVSAVMCCISKKRRKTVYNQEEDQSDSTSCKQKSQKTKSDMQAVYYNVPKRR
ncbi:CD48 antigen isoform X1 [Danio rerio]|uniref:CD48 antigen isoform X1 n=1 Tax=Danio rerio TaxID=7955 RepID=A0AB32TCA3_DANRE